MALRNWLMYRESGAARIKNVFRAVKRLDSVCGVGLDRSILVDVYPDIVERYRLASARKIPGTSGDHSIYKTLSL